MRGQAPTAREGKPPASTWELDEIVRRRRLREHGRRPLAVNLAEGIALSELLARFRGAARR